MYKRQNPGDEKTILVDVKYPDGSTDKKVPAKVIVLNEPGYGEVTDKPGEKVELPQTGDVVDGSTFTINPKQDLGDWKPVVDEKTGKVTVTIPENAKPGDEKEILVDVKDPKSGKTDTVPAKVIVHGAPEYPAVEKTPGDKVTLPPKTDGVPPKDYYPVLALLTYGEGYHNYHHIFQYDYRNGVKWWQYDPTKWFILALSKLGLAKNLKKAG